MGPTLFITIPKALEQALLPSQGSLPALQAHLRAGPARLPPAHIQIVVWLCFLTIRHILGRLSRVASCSAHAAITSLPPGCSSPDRLVFENQSSWLIKSGWASLETHSLTQVTRPSLLRLLLISLVFLCLLSTLFLLMYILLIMPLQLSQFFPLCPPSAWFLPSLQQSPP